MRERVASLLNFVPIDLETTITVEGSSLQNFITATKLRLFHKAINDNITVTMEVRAPDLFHNIVQLFSESVDGQLDLRRSVFG